MPCSAALVVVFSFVSAVVGVLLVVPVTVSAWSVVARGEAKTVTAELPRSSVPRAALQLQGALVSGDGRPIRASHHRRAPRVEKHETPERD